MRRSQIIWGNDAMRDHVSYREIESIYCDSVPVHTESTVYVTHTTRRVCGEFRIDIYNGCRRPIKCHATCLDSSAAIIFVNYYYYFYLHI